MAIVAALRVAPVKGLATVMRDRIHIERDGVADDRRLFLLDQRGSVVTLRSHPQLVQVTPDLNLQTGRLSVTLPDGTVASSALGDARDPVTARLYGKDRPGQVLPGQVADCLSAIAGEPVRVVLADRVGVGWDEGPVSILGRASADAVGGPSLDRARYRMLIEVDDTQSYEEDSWIGRRIEVGDARLEVLSALVRCVIITQSPTTGEQDWDGLQVLAGKRGPDLCLGVIAEVLSPGDVWLGAAVAPVD
jgi:uncharacterized protein